MPATVRAAPAAAGLPPGQAQPLVPKLPRPLAANDIPAGER